MQPGAAGELSQPASFSDLPGWADDDCVRALAAFRASAALGAEHPPKTRAFGVDGGALARLAMAARDVEDTAARIFFEQNFTPRRILPRGFVTGYFEPVVVASRVPSSRFRVPLYRRPSELAELPDTERGAGWDPAMRFARRTGEGFEPFFDRAAIETGALSGRGLELAFLEDPVDAFFIHVQGSARLALAEGPGAGMTLRIAFDGKSGHPYTAIGRLAVERGLLTLEQADKDGLESWLRAHPAEAISLMRENRSFIFFRETDNGADLGPVGAAGLPLTPLGSLAVDRRLHTFQTPILVTANTLEDPERGGPFRRLMIAQDTGSAIVGPARGDIFFGSGAEAGTLAGRVRHPATMVILAPKASA